jgi:dipeptidyl aminopeptidase/acylaminoacyl peptidase
VATLASGTRLTATQRSTDNRWLYVQGAENLAGWVAMSEVLVFNTRVLPAQEVAITPVQPTATPAPTATPITQPTEQSQSTSASKGQPPAPAPAAAPAQAVTASQAAPGGLRGKIVLQTEWGGAIYLYDLASGALRQLTHGFDPALSPDGQEVAFTRTGGEHGLWLIKVDGSNERNIFGERHGFFAPKWSPDGQWLLFMRTDSAFDCEVCIPDVTRRRAKPWARVRPRLAKVDKNGNNYLDLATLDTATAPDWNSAGVVYTSEAGIQFATPDGQDNNRRVYFNILQQHYRDPDWQPGGGKIVFQQRKGGHTDLFAINLDGSGLTPLTRPETVLVDELPSNVAPAWSPDGQHLVFLSNRMPDHAAGPWGIWVMNADGSNPRRLPIDLPFVYNDVEEQKVDWGP